MQFSIYVPDDLAEKINSRLPRSVKVSTISRWLLMGLVLTNKEIEAFCLINEEEARSVQPYLQDALQKLFAVTNTAKDESKKRGAK